MRVVGAALLVVGLAGCAAGATPSVLACGSVADQTAARGGGVGPSCEGPPRVIGSPFADRLFDSGRQGGDIGHSGRAGVYER